VKYFLGLTTIVCVVSIFVNCMRVKKSTFDITEVEGLAFSTFLSSSLKQKYFLLILGGNTTKTAIYDPVLEDLRAGPDLTSAAGLGASGFLIQSGPHKGKIFIVHGGGSFTSSIYDPANENMTGGLNMPASTTVNDGGQNLTVSSGLNGGKQFIIHAGGLTAVSVYDHSLHSLTAGSAYTSGPNTGGQVFNGLNGNFRTVLGSGGNGTELYNATTGLFGAGLNLAGGTAGAGGNNFLVTAGAAVGQQMVIHGGNANAYSLYDPVTDTYPSSGSLIPCASGNVGSGGGNFAISGGPLAGQTIIIVAGGTSSTCAYSHTANAFSTGPVLTNTVSNKSSTYQFSSGTFLGKILVIHGTGTATSFFNPVSGQFETGLALPSLSGSGNFIVEYSK